MDKLICGSHCKNEIVQWGIFRNIIKFGFLGQLESRNGVWTANPPLLVQIEVAAVGLAMASRWSARSFDSKEGQTCLTQFLFVIVIDLSFFIFIFCFMMQFWFSPRRVNRNCKKRRESLDCIAMSVCDWAVSDAKSVPVGFNFFLFDKNWRPKYLLHAPHTFCNLFGSPSAFHSQINPWFIFTHHNKPLI